MINHLGGVAKVAVSRTIHAAMLGDTHSAFDLFSVSRRAALIT